jgi:hypothetical protein
MSRASAFGFGLDGIVLSFRLRRRAGFGIVLSFRLPVPDWIWYCLEPLPSGFGLDSWSMIGLRCMLGG